MNPEKDFAELKDIFSQHEGLRYKELVSPEERPERLLGINGIHLLLKFLERSYDLLEGSIDTYSRHKTLQFYILVRSHFETTANLGYFLSNLRKFYNNEITVERIDEVVGKLSVGSRKKSPDNSDLVMPDSVSVLTTIDVVDKLLDRDINMFRNSYDTLSEFSHPNFFGISYKTKVSVEQGNVLFLSDRDSFERFAKGGLPKLLITANVFMMFYREAYSLIEKNETMPKLIK